MKLRIRLPAKSDPVHMFIDASDDGGNGREFVFDEGRVIPVYYYYPGERRGYVLRNQGETQGSLPNIEGSYTILLAVRGPEVERLEKGVRKLYAEAGALEEIPQPLWPKLGVLTTQRGFRIYMVKELYLAVQEKYILQQELNPGAGP